MRRAWRFAAALASALALAGCAGLPTSGPPQPGPTFTVDPVSPDVTFRPDAPQPGATPEQIVNGFVTAASGPQGDWETARLYLADGFRDEWQPEAGVIVDVLADRLLSATPGDVLNLQVTARATVDEHGAYSPSDGGVPAPLSYTLAQQADGEWRITHAPDGILLDEDLFRSVFRSYAVMYFDPTWEFLVPDVRWFPTVNAPTRVADALVNGAPSSWLARSVTTAFPENVDLLPSVPAPRGVAQAQLSEQALTVDQVTLDRMQTQLSASLATASVTQVEMLVDGTRVEAQAVPVAKTTVDARALVGTADGFGFLVSDELTAVPGLSDTIEAAQPTAVELGRDRASAALHLPDGTVAVVVQGGAVVPVDTRAGLRDPTIDPFGTVWSVPGANPTALHATTLDGETIDIADAFPGVNRIHALQISRDGTRMAAIVGFGSRPVLVVAGVIRDADGVPSALADPVTLAELDGDGGDVGWLDDATVGAVVGGGEGATYVEQPVGGITAVLEAPAGAETLSGVNIPSAVRIRTADGGLFVRRSSNWVQTASGVQVLATQQGSP